MNTKQAAYAVVGGMQSVAGPVVDAYELSQADDIKSAVNKIKASVSLAASYASSPSRYAKDVVIRHAELVLDNINNLSEHCNESVDRQLDFARKAAKELDVMLKLYKTESPQEGSDMNAKEKVRLQANRITIGCLIGGRAVLLKRLVDNSIADGNTDASVVEAWDFDRRVDEIVDHAVEVAKHDGDNELLLEAIKADCREVERFVVEELGLFFTAAVIRRAA